LLKTQLQKNIIYLIAGLSVISLIAIGVNNSNQKTDNNVLVIETDNNLITDNIIISPTIILPTDSVVPTLTSTLVPTIKPTTKPATPKPTSTPNSPTNTPTPTSLIDYTHPWTVAPGCPATTMACIPCTSGTDCRYEPGQTHGFRGWACQDNNPGNIRNASTNMATDFKNLMIIRNGGTAACGVRYDSRGGSYFVFANYNAGYEGLKAYIRAINNGEHPWAYTGCGDCTLSTFFASYAGGDTGYATAVAAYIGEPVTQTLRYVVANKLEQFATAIKIHEGFITY
jgi:hypothetical protein